MILSGMSNLEQVMDNIKTFSEEKPLSEDEKKVLDNLQNKMITSTMLDKDDIEQFVNAIMVFTNAEIDNERLEAIKKYGFFGYAHSSDPDQHAAEQMNINQLLFIKAYALDALEIRTVKKVWENTDHDYASASSLEKELELLLFDM